MIQRDLSRNERVGLALSWGVHLLTASGAVLGAFAMVFAVSGRLGLAAILMLIALVVDAVDGTLARAARVTEFVPEIDGRRLDDIVDYLNFVIVPMLFMWSAGSLVHWSLIAAPILASAYGFARVDAKTEDDFFLGFPSYWNILAIYLWLLEVSPAIGTTWVVVLSVAVFVPLKYLYPSKVQPISLRFWLGAGAILWTGALMVCILRPEEASKYLLLEASLAYPVWYLVLSFRRGGLHRPSRSVAP